MAALFEDFRFYAGHDVALGTLTVLKSSPYFRSGGRVFLPAATSIEWFPIRHVQTDGDVRGGGRIDVDWVFATLPRTTVSYLLTTFYGWPSARVAAVPLTIYTIDVFANTWYRMNCKSELIIPSDFSAYLGGDRDVNDVIWRHRKLQAAS